MFKKLNDKGIYAIKKVLPRNSPDFIIIGAQKSGTSSVHYYLSQHPGLQASKPKEIHYFDKWINHGYSRKWYEYYFKSFGNNKLYFEASPNYIYHHSAAQSLSMMYPGIKMILILREPVERAFSAWNMYKHMFDKGYDMNRLKGKYPGEPNPVHQHLMKDRTRFPTFSETLDIELELMEKGESIEPSILRRGLYIDQLKNYYQYFEKEQILVLGFRDLLMNTKSFLDKIFEFLGVESMPYKKIKLKALNQRDYTCQLKPQEQSFLEEFYRQPNKELFQHLQKEINW